MLTTAGAKRIKQRKSGVFKVPNIIPNSDSRNLTTKQKIEELKAENSDFEWYPTTDEIINIIGDDVLKADSLYQLNSLLDIGCGDGRVLKKLKSQIKAKSKERYSIGKLYGVEKARLHIAQWSDDITFLGSDFYSTNISAIESDIIFCNPPYSSFEEWAASIIKNSFTSVVYLVLPCRWSKSDKIKAALNKRSQKAEVIHTTDFLNAERQARAKVDIVRIVSDSYKKTMIKNAINDKPYSFRGYNKNDPFDNWFNENFSDVIEKSEGIDTKADSKTANKSEVFDQKNTIDDLVNFYQRDLKKVVDSFLILNQLDTSVFDELKIDIATIKRSLKEKIKSLKADYWQEFINNYEPITKRLTSKYRDKIYSNLMSKTKQIDFTAMNALIITEMVIKKADEYTAEQVKDFFYNLSAEDAILNYKSNQKVFTGGGGWRYMKPDGSNHSHYQLDYRIVQHRTFSVDTDWNGNIRGYGVAQAINDICVIARLVGMPLPDYCNGAEYKNETVFHGKRLTVDYFDINNDAVTELFAIKFFKNGNQHLFLNKDFILRLNIMMGKLCGWVHNANDAYEEMKTKNSNKQDFEKMYKSVKTDTLSLGYTAEFLIAV